jgi:hypothetical protein
MADESLVVLVTREMPDGTFAAVDALDNLRITKAGFKNADEAEKFIEDFYIARGVLRPRAAKQ